MVLFISVKILCAFNIDQTMNSVPEKIMGVFLQKIIFLECSSLFLQPHQLSIQLFFQINIFKYELSSQILKNWRKDSLCIFTKSTN